MPRPSSPELCDAFRALLTTGFHVDEGADRDAILAATKPWRADLWRAFREIENRLCPFPGRAPERAAEPSENDNA